MSPTDSTQSNGSTVSIEFPFRLQSDLAEFAITADMHVRRMDDATKSRLLRIKNMQYTANGMLSEFICLPASLLSHPTGPSININTQFCSSNYVLIARSREQAADFNLALKLADNSCSSLYIGYQSTGETHFLTPCYYGRSVLVITQEDAKKLSRLVELIAQRRSDTKLQTMSEIYLRSLSLELREETRFIETAVILEMLLLPSKSSELSYRFSLRLAKLMSKLFGESVTEAFGHARSIYTTRSNLVHNGSDKKLDSVSPVAYRYVRTLLAAYLDNKDLFQEKYLEELCLS